MEENPVKQQEKKLTELMKEIKAEIIAKTEESKLEILREII